MMDYGASLQTPRSAGGRSRFSKALPAPPPALDSMLTPRKMPSSPVPPPPPKEKDAAMARPLDSPLPPLPLKDRAPPPMSIPRRPVGNMVPAGEPSPVASISSLLSAYSRTSGESILRSSEGTASTKTSYIAASPEQVGMGGDLKKEELLTPLSSLSIDVDSQKQPQEGRKPFTPGLPRSPLDSMGATSPGGFSTSSPSLQQSPQLWRRRSIKTEKNLAVSELKLTASHGSTASTQHQGAVTASSLVPPQPPFADPTTDGPVQTKSPVGLPGRNIRPVASREPVAQTPEMGQTMARIEGQVDARLHRRDGKGATTTGGEQHNTAELNLPIQRLPTPDYDHHDIKSPLLETIVSPISPASSPELPSKESGPRLPVARKAVVDRDVRPAKSTTSLRTQHRDISPPPPEMPDFRSQQRPRDPAATREVAAANQTQFPARTSSKTAEQPKVVLRRQPAETQPVVQPRLVKSRDSGAEVDEEPSHLDAKVAPPLSLDTSGEHVPSHAELNDGETSPGADHPPFPVSFTEIAPPGTIFTAPPLSTKNFMCMQRHRHMFRDRNTHCPLSCQSCQKQDTEMRFKCKWCYLRICQSCMDILHENQRDLQRLVEHLKNPPPPPSREDELQSPTDFSSQIASPTSMVQES